MSIRNHIKKILSEETELGVKIRRRLSLVDDAIEWRLTRTFSPQNICRFETAEEMLEHLTDLITDEIIADEFPEFIDTSRETNIIWREIGDYIMNKYGSKLYEYYHINCGN